MTSPDLPHAPQPGSPEEGIRAEAQVAPSPTTVKLPPPPTPLPASPEAFLRRMRFLDYTLVAVLLVFSFLVALFPVRNSDFLSQLATGRLVAQGQYVFGSDPYSFGSQGSYWANHSWLFGVTSYALYQLQPVGPTLLIVLKALAVAALAEVMLRIARPAGRSLWIPAACVALALLVVSARVYLQPVVVSYLFLALTLLLLETQRRRDASSANGPARFDLRWLLPPLFALWVNFDSWFLLGPTTVGLYLLGQLLTVKVDPQGGGNARLGRLAVVLVVGVGACLLNPYHVHAFTLPAQLGLSPAGEALGEDDIYKRLFVSPISADYVGNSSLGQNVAGMAYFPLVAACLTSFALAGASGLGWRATVTLPFLLLSLWHSRAIPFFAVVAGPVSALNFLDFAARKFGSATGPDAVPRGWAVGGRVLTLAVLVLLTVLSWPGRLQPTPQEHRRVGWDFQFDPELERTARQIARWRQEGLLAEGPGWFNTIPDTVGDYLAWFAPGERVFVDLRMTLYSAEAAGDYLAARRDLVTSSGPNEAQGGQGESWRELFRKQGVRYVFLVDNGTRRPTVSLLGRARVSPDEWSVCEVSGRSILFAWNDPRSRTAAPKGEPRWDAARAAFGPGAEPAPRERPAGSAEPREWYTALWRPEAYRSGPADQAAALEVDFEVNAQLERQRAQKIVAVESGAAFTAAVAALGAARGGPAAGGAGAWASLLGNQDFIRGYTGWYSARYQQARDDGPPADLYLMVRAARRAVAANPSDARPHLLLGKAYLALKERTRERSPGYQSSFLLLVRQAQVLAELSQAVLLNPDDDSTHELLARQFQQVQFIDLWLKHLEEIIRIRRAGGGKASRGVDPVKEQEQLESEAGKLREEVRRRIDQHEIKTASRPGADRARAALEMGLAETALTFARDVIRKVQPGEDPAQAGLALATEVYVLTITGRQAEAREHFAAEVRDVLNTAPAPPLPQGCAFDWYSTLLAATSGDYAEADRAMGDLVPRIRPPTNDVATFTAAWWVQGASTAFGRPTIEPRLLGLREVVGGTYQMLSLQAQMELARAALAMESGDLGSARDQLTGLLTRTGHRGGGPVKLDFAGRPLAQLYLEWLDAAR